MNRQFREDRHLVVKDFLDCDRTRRLAHELRTYFATVPLSADGQCPNSPAVYNYLPIVELLIEKLPYIAQCVGLTLLPTFCYARSYTHGERLAPHCDRPAGEISATVHLESDHVWPIFFGHPLTGISEVVLEPGQAVIYQGCEVTHWRDPFVGQSY